MHTYTKKHFSGKVLAISALLLTVICVNKAKAQAEFEPWGNMSGMRLKGQLIPFTTSIDFAGKSLSKMQSTGKERQSPKYARNGSEQTVITKIDKFNITETINSNNHGNAQLIIKCTPAVDTTINGLYLEVKLPHEVYTGNFKLIGKKEQLADQLQIGQEAGYLYEYAEGIQFKAGNKKFSIKSITPLHIIIMPKKDTADKSWHIYLPICTGKLTKGKVYQAQYSINAKDRIGRDKATVTLDSTVQGRQFTGFGGNFRLQNTKNDPQVIDYCLSNMRVAWGRVEMPWRNWQPDININPIEAAGKGNLNNHVKESMEMAQRLGKLGMPVIVTAWAPPAWAVEGKLVNGKSPEGIWGNPLNQPVMQQIYRSVTDYLIYLRDHYGTEANYFSFNESDLGINVRQTAEQHNELIKGMGAYFVANGLKTKLLLGDNSDATTYRFIDVAMNDPAARPYIGAISFHSWRGWDTPTLQKWADAATRLKLPLIVGEGSIDAAAYAYPAYFLEQSYALAEISLYTRLLAICQPASILQWQLTADYSPLAGGGIFGDNGPLRPTQRFWNLKQLASTPPDLYAMPSAINRADMVCAALGDNDKHVYCFHLVNNGAARQLNINGLPTQIKSFNVYVTDKSRAMKQMGTVKVKKQKATLKIDAGSYVTLISTQ